MRIIQRGNCPRGRDTGTARARRAPGWRSRGQRGCRLAAMTLRLAEDHDRIADGLDDIVARRLFSAGPTLEAELDLAIRDMAFDSGRPDWPAVGRSG